jgi:hypothetical protein
MGVVAEVEQPTGLLIQLSGSCVFRLLVFKLAAAKRVELQVLLVLRRTDADLKNAIPLASYVHPNNNTESTVFFSWFCAKKRTRIKSYEGTGFRPFLKR